MEQPHHGSPTHDDQEAPLDADHLRRALDEQGGLLTGPDVSDVVRARVRRVLDSTRDLLELSAEEPVREVAGRAVAWVAESVGAFQRLPRAFASGHAVLGEHAPLLRTVDQLDLLGLTLDRAYDGARRGDGQAVRGQLDVLLERFPARTRPASLAEPVGICPEDLDDGVVHDHGLEVGEDGIPRLPVPDQPDPDHETQEVG
ncbi:hypothetical protein [Ornithinimicrobium avium]|uniref:Uncharacterized protein n=1 Tax=Ornithinimicrobium avium TaxID=2283195 RepID=A0A345NL04_9MICO|nr:hypothetical protein [Ornithinimicrobium avium]AXH95712.1 hypothetical protein DV701_05870 [Ornithinimicrobium avium]